MAAITVPRKLSLTFDERIAAFTGFTAKFFVYLETSGGIVLSADIRLIIARLARDVLIHGEKISVVGDPGDPYREKSAFLATVVDTLINQQGQIDESWYQATVKSLDAMFVPEKFEKLQRIYYTHVVFSEITLVATMSHSLHSFFLAIGTDAPALPTEASQDATPPSFFDWTKVIKHQKKPRHDPAEAYAPYLLSADVDPNAKEFKKLKLSNVKMDFLRWIVMVKPPWSCVMFAVDDFVWMQQWFDVSYFVKGPPGAFKRFFLAFLPLDTTKRCSESVSRYDLEVVAHRVAVAYGCGY